MAARAAGGPPPGAAAAGGSKSEMIEPKDGPKRFDPNCPRGKSYTRRQFMAADGGTAEWDAAKGREDVPKKPKLKLTIKRKKREPAAVPMAAELTKATTEVLEHRRGRCCHFARSL